MRRLHRRRLWQTRRSAGATDFLEVGPVGVRCWDEAVVLGSALVFIRADPRRFGEPPLFRRPSRLFRGLVGALALSCLGLPACGPQGPATFPSRPLKIICPWSAGGGTDRITRFVAEALKEQLGAPCAPINQTGGGGVAGHAAGATASADGHTLTTITFELSTMRAMGLGELSHRDFRCLMQLNADPAAIIVRADAPWKSLEELLDYVREHPGELRMTGTESGGAWDLARAGLLIEAGLKVGDVTWAPKRGAAPSLVELLGGHVEAVCCSLPEAAASLDGGQLRALAVMADERLESYPEVPTAREQGVAWTAVGWRGVAVPKGTPDEASEALLKALRTVTASPAFADFMDKNGFQITLREGDAFEAFLAEQEAQWAPVIQAAGFAEAAR